MILILNQNLKKKQKQEEEKDQQRINEADQSRAQMKDMICVS